MPQCLNCGAHVTSHFARVMGDNNDDAHRCPSCANNRAITEEAGKGG